MRLVDADALKEKFKERSYWTYTHEYGDAIPIGWIMSGIDNAPTVERPQGEWKTNLTTGDIFCSCCKEVRRDTRIKHINFCNSCGADMRGEE